MITTLGKTFPRNFNKNYVDIGEDQLDELLNKNNVIREDKKTSSVNKGKLYRGAVCNAYNRQSLGSIPQRNEMILIKSMCSPKGFSCQSDRFPATSLEKLAIPGPGTYTNTASTEFTNPSLSSKGYGVGFVSKKERFDDLQEFYSKYLPGPGQNIIKNNLSDGIQKSMQYKGLFIDKKVERLIPKKDNPGPGSYDYDYNWIRENDENNFFFKDKVKRKKMIIKEEKDNPGPADYFKTYKDKFVKEGEKENYFFKKPLEKKEDIIDTYLNIKKKDRDLGPGSYIFDNEIKKEEPMDTIELHSLLEREEKNQRAKKRRILSMELAKSIVQSTDFYEKPSKFDAIAKDNSPSSIFVSKTKKNSHVKLLPVPGPFYYKPNLIPNNINFNCNEEVWK